MAWSMSRYRLGRHYLGSALLAARDDVVDQTVRLGLRGGEEAVACDVAAHLLPLLPGVPGQDLLHLLADAQDLVGLDLDVAGLAVPALGGGLVDQDPRVRQRGALAGRTGRQQDRGG